MRRFTSLASRAAIVLALCAAAVTCSGESMPSAPFDDDGGRQAGTNGAGNTTATPTGNAVVRGIVLGVDSAGGRRETTEGIEGADVTVVRVERAPGLHQDTLTTPPTLTKVGTVTTGKNGAFELSGVVLGYFYLDVVPPAGSKYKSGRAGSVSFPAGSTDKAYVYLYP